MKFEVLGALLVCVCATVSAQTKTKNIQPDTLADLKAEYEYQKRELAPWLVVVEEAKKDHMLCQPDCRTADRRLQVALDFAQPILEKSTAAKEAYEREQRKADRNKKK